MNLTNQSIDKSMINSPVQQLYVKVKINRKMRVNFNFIQIKKNIFRVNYFIINNHNKIFNK